MNIEGYWFKSSNLEIEPGEDEEINPGIYGRQLAQWLKERLEQKGYRVAEIINEDWGRCLMCSRDPFMLWVGCGSVTDDVTAQPGDGPPAKEDVVWHCFATAEVFLLEATASQNRNCAGLVEALRRSWRNTTRRAGDYSCSGAVAIAQYLDRNIV